MVKPLANIEFKLVETKEFSINEHAEKESKALAEKYFSNTMVIYENGLLQEGKEELLTSIEAIINLSANTQNVKYLDNRMKTSSGYYQSLPVHINGEKAHIQVNNKKLYAPDVLDILHATPKTL